MAACCANRSSSCCGDRVHEVRNIVTNRLLELLCERCLETCRRLRRPHGPDCKGD